MRLTFDVSCYIRETEFYLTYTRDRVLSFLFYLFYRKRKMEVDKSCAGIKIPQKKKKINKKSMLNRMICVFIRVYIYVVTAYTFRFDRYIDTLVYVCIYYFKSSLYALPM